MTKTMTDQLPRIIEFRGVTDAGEFGATTCPHCGSKGRYIYHFTCEDGVNRGAMAGCIKLFPVSKIAKVQQSLLKKEQDLVGQTWPNGDPKGLNKWDAAKMDAIQGFYNGTMTEDQVIGVFQTQDYNRNEWMQKKGYRR